MKIDKKGEPTWEKRFHHFLSRSLIATRDSNFIFILTTKTTSSKIVKINGNGDSIWETNLKQNYDLIKVIESNDSSYVYFGHKLTLTGSDIVVGKIDFEGHQLWETIYGTADREYGEEIGIFSDNNIMAVISNSTEGGKLYFVKINPGGEPLWIKPLNTLEYSTNLLITPKDKILLSVYHEYSCYDSTGNLEWQKNFPTGFYGDLNDMLTINDSTFILVGCSDPTYDFVSNDEQVEMVTINSAGDQILGKSYRDRSANITGGSIKSADDKGYIILGTYFQEDHINDGKIFILKTDSIGNIDNYFVTGKVFNDLNSNGSYEGNEPGIPNVLVRTADNKYNCLTDSLGNYKMTILEMDSFQIMANIPEHSNQTVPLAPDFYSIHFTQSFQTLENNNFGFSSVDSIYDLKSYLSGSAPVPGSLTDYIIHVNNIGARTVQNPVISFYFDDKFTFESSGIVPDIIQPNYVKWTLDSLTPSTSFTTRIKLTLSSSGSIPGDTVMNILVAEPLDIDNTPDNNNFILQQEVVSAKEENHKSAFPSMFKEERFINEKIDTIRFLIEFKNTGNDTVFNLTITDTLSSSLDLNKLEILGSSHNYVYFINNNVISFLFKNINLTQSYNNINNYGFIEYSVPLSKDLTMSDTIKNTAYLCYDYAPDVITNSAKVFIKIPYSENKINEANNALDVYPNPNDGSMKVILKDVASNADIHLKVLDIKGRLILNKSFVLKDNQIDLNLGEHQTGIFILLLEIENSVYRKKIIVL